MTNSTTDDITSLAARHGEAVAKGDWDEATRLGEEMSALINAQREAEKPVDDRPTERPIEVKVYVETAEQAAWQGDHAPPPVPIKLAKERMSNLLRAEGYSLRDSSVKEVKGSRMKVATDDSEQGYHEVRNGPTGKPLEAVTGIIATFTGVGVLSDGDDSNVPIVTVEPDENGLRVALVPQAVTDRGGDLRVRHGLGTDEIVVRLRKRNGTGVAYIIGSDLDGNVFHIVGADKGAHDVIVVPDSEAEKPAKVEQPARSMPEPESGEPVIH